MAIDTLKIERSIILLVEGSDELIFFEYFFSHLKSIDGNLWENLENIQVINCEGISNFEIYLKTILSITGSEIIRKIGIIRDADLDSESAFLEIKNAIINAKTENPELESPNQQLIPTTGHPTINVMIVPETGSGSIEIYFLESVKNDLAFSCVETFFTCLEPFYSNNRLERPTNLHKSKLHVFLASRKVPKASIGGGAQKRYWDYQDPSFDRMKFFLKTLIQ